MEAVAHDDAELLAAYRAGDDSAFERLVSDCGPRLYAVALRLCRDRSEAEELVQETLVRAFVKLDSFESRARFFTWLYRILTNLWKNRVRQQRRWRTVPLAGDDPDEPRSGAELVDPGPSPAEQAERADYGRLLQQILPQLPDRYRIVLVLREVEEMDYAQIAETLELPIGTVRSRLARARGRLQTLVRAALDAEVS